MPDSAANSSATALLATRRRLSRRRQSIDPWFRRGVLALLALVVTLALLNAFGQRPLTSDVRNAAAELRVQSPQTLRGGLIYQSRFTVTARRALRHPTLVLANGWFESMSVNSIVPQPSGQASRDGDVRLSYPRMRAGDSLTVWIYFQVNPTNVGSRSQDVELDDGAVRLAGIERDVRVWP